MRKTASYTLGELGAIIALFSSGFYILFTETIWVREFWIGVILFSFALFGTISIFIIRKKPGRAKIFFYVAGIGGILSLLCLAGFNSTIADNTFMNRPTLLYFSGYILFLFAGLAIKKQ